MLSFFLLLGVLLFVGFGWLALPLPNEPESDYGNGLNFVARLLWPIGLAILVISLLVWLYESVLG